MTENIITYGVITAISILAIFAFTIGIDKMMRIILGNYILNSICLAGGQSLTIAAQALQKTPEATMLGMQYSHIANFLTNGSMTILLIIYIILLIIVYKTSKLRIILPEDEALKKMLQIIFVPLTILSCILTLQIVIFGISTINVADISAITTNPYIIQFIQLTPVRIFLHGIITILMSSEFKLRVQTDI